MNNKMVVPVYLTALFMFCITFKFGLQYSFHIDTGYVGPLILFHCIAIIASLFGEENK